MMCEEFKSFIQSYLDNDLSEEVEKEWQQHFEECSACRTKVRIYERCIAMMRRFMREECPPKTLREKLKQKLGCDCFDFCAPRWKGPSSRE